MLCNLVQFLKPCSEFLQLINLLVSYFLSFNIFCFQFGKLFCQVGKPMCCFLDLLQHIRFTLLDYIIKFLLSLKLIYLQLPFKLLLLFYLFFSSLQITLEVEQEIRLLNKLKTSLQFIVFLHQIDNCFVCNLNLALGNCSPYTLDGYRFRRVFASFTANNTLSFV